MALLLHLKATIPVIVSGAPITRTGHELPTLRYFFVGTSGKTMEICSLEPPQGFLPLFSALNAGSESFSHNIFHVQCVEG